MSDFIAKFDCTHYFVLFFIFLPNFAAASRLLSVSGIIPRTCFLAFYPAPRTTNSHFASHFTHLATRTSHFTRRRRFYTCRQRGQAGGLGAAPPERKKRRFPLSNVKDLATGTSRCRSAGNCWTGSRSVVIALVKPIMESGNTEENIKTNKYIVFTNSYYVHIYLVFLERTTVKTTTKYKIHNKTNIYSLPNQQQHAEIVEGLRNKRRPI